jgi:Filamentous haemagglutinin family outer membrane protein
VAADQEAFSGADGSRLEQIATRLTAGNASLAATQVVVRPGIEVRATGDLKVSSDWSLPSAAPVRATAPHAGDTSLTIRSAGALNVAAPISTGFTLAEGAPASEGVASSDRSGSIVLVSGADVAAADTRKTVASAAANLTIGNEGNEGNNGATVAVRTTTGDIGLFSGRDIVWLNNRATVYSAGQPVVSPVAFQQLLPTEIPNAVFDSGSPLLSGGGAVTLKAERDVLGVPVSADRPSITDWWWRSSSSVGQVSMWWSRTDLFDQGVGSFGGGAVSVSAGRDLVNLHASAASSGLLGQAGEAPLFLQAGGKVDVRAGRDLVNGAIYAAGSSLDVTAGRAILRDAVRSNDADPGVQLVHEQTAVRVQAGADITLASVRNAGLMLPTSDGTINPSGLDTTITGMQYGASLSVQSTAGSIVYVGTAQPVSTRLGNPSGPYRLVGNLLPGDVSFLAPAGAVTLGGANGGGPSGSGQIAVLPSLSGGVQVLARDAVVLEAILVVAAARGPEPLAVGLVDSESARVALLLASGLTEAGTLDAGSRTPLRFASATGDVQVNSGLRSARPVRVLAGEDLSLGAAGRIVVQHQANVGAPSELSLVQAGRDVIGGTALSNGAGIEIGGPGDLVVLAGRDVDLGTSRGITATGNRDASTVLPVGGANVTVVAGLRADGSDYRRAAREGFALIGPAALAGHAGDLFALLQPATAGAAPAVGTASEATKEAARTFDAASTPQQLDQVRTLLGAARFDAAAIAFVHGLPKQAGLDDAQALKAFAALPDGTQRLAAGVLLTRAFGELPAATRSAFLADLSLRDASAAADTNRKAFTTFMASALGSAPASVQEGLTAFEQLPLERQAVWLNQVLVSQVRLYGRDAAQKGGAERTDAYTRGYLAIDALFPWVADAGSDIRLPTSQIRTVQAADITLLAPRGGVNAGALVAGSTRAADLGIITVAGGNISSIVRDNFEVNQSRVFSLKRGDILMWASEGDIDAGRGAKTVSGAPAPVPLLDNEGRFTLDTSGSFSGSGIAVLDSSSALDLYAPQGEINAGEAGIKSLGTAFFGAQTFRGTDDIKVSGASVGAPPPPPSSASLAGLSTQAAATAGTKADAEESEDDKRKKRRARRNLLLDFLGFGAERS